MMMPRRAALFVFLLVAVLVWLAPAQAGAQISVLTQRYDTSRSGVNANETSLTVSNVNTNSFGKLFSLPTDGWVYAQPLYVPGVAIPSQGTHNVVYIVTAHDGVYGYDADGLVSTPLWYDSLINPSAGITTQPVSDNPNNSDIDSEIGIFSTPVINSSTGTLYLVAKTDETSGGTTNHCFRIHALDITSGADRTGSPTACLQASVSGTGSPSDGAGHVLFSADLQIQRTGLLLVGNTLYIAFGSWSDTTPYHGWLLGYDETSLEQVAAFTTTPNGTEGEGGIWMHGNGLAVDTNGYIFFSTGNGAFDGASNFGDSVLKLATPGLTMTDYFTPYNQSTLDAGDLDVAAGGLTLLPASAGTTQHPEIAIACGKNGAIYVLDGGNLGHFNSAGDTQIIQELLNVIGGTHVSPTSSTYVANCYTSATYWNGNVYFGGVSDFVKTFTFANGLLSTSAVAQGPTTYQYPGTTPMVSANGTTNGIVWAVENSGTVHGFGTATNEVLHAYSATNVADELYNSTQVASDAAGAPVKYALPLVANGKVYVGTQSSVAVYGLFSYLPQAPEPSFNPPGGNYASAQSVALSDSLSTATIYYTTNGSTPTTSSNVYNNTPIAVSATTTINAMAAAAGYSNSPVSNATYVIGSNSLAFVQGNYSAPQTPESTVSVTYTNSQVAGDLNVVVVGWSDSTATIAAGGVTDSNGNAYTLAAGPTVQSGTATQAIYYAKDIKGGTAGANKVTVTFSAAAKYPDVRILEYSGADPSSPFDVAASATGSSTSSSVGITTSNASDAIVAANLVQSTTTGAGSGFTSRMITSPDGDIVEDRFTTTAGAYTAAATVSPSGAWIMQAVAFKAANLTPTTTTPTISPAGGTYNNTQPVTLSDTTTGATIYYTTDGTTPTSPPTGTTTQYTTGTQISVTATGTTIEAIASSSGNQNSTVASATYTLVTATPTFVSPSPGTYTSKQKVVLGDATTGSTIYYTIDGTTPTIPPTGTTQTYTGAITVSATTTINAIAGTTGFGNSGVLSGTFTIQLPTTATPTMTPAGGTYNSTQSVTLSDSTSGSTIYYTTDGTTPTIPPTGTTTQYTTGSVIPVTTTGTIINAIASSSGNQNSAVASATYTLVTATPTFSPAPGTYTSAQSVQLSDATTGYAVYYTTDGTTPTIPPTGTTKSYTAAIPVSATTTISAIAGATGFKNSAVAVGTYTIGAPVISFAQVAASTPQSPVSTLSLAYPSAQTAGDLNVVVVGWNDATSSVTAVTDKNGNTYQLAIGPTRTTGLSQAIYYANNITGGSNTVTVTFNQAAAYVDLRILEYKGITNPAPLDATAGATGSSATASVSATTTAANELIVAADTVLTANKAAGSGYTARIITTPDSDLVEDRTASTAGSYSATATLTSSGAWVMQVVSFKSQ